MWMDFRGTQIYYKVSPHLSNPKYLSKQVWKQECLHQFSYFFVVSFVFRNLVCMKQHVHDRMYTCMPKLDIHFCCFRKDWRWSPLCMILHFASTTPESCPVPWNVFFWLGLNFVCHLSCYTNMLDIKFLHLLSEFQLVLESQAAEIALRFSSLQSLNPWTSVYTKWLKLRYTNIARVSFKNSFRFMTISYIYPVLQNLHFFSSFSPVL